MNRTLTNRRVSVLVGAIKWLPVIAMPFGVFLFETWLQVLIYERDYETTELKNRIKDTTSHIGRLQEHADELMALKRVSEQAPDLGLAPIEPGQVEVLYLPEPPAQPVSPLNFVETMTIADAAPLPKRE